MGDTEDRGNAATETGDYLMMVDLGTHFKSRILVVGSVHAAAISTNGTVKSWGRNAYGELGYGNTANIGDFPGQMGDNLTRVDLGTGFNATEMASGPISYHKCVWDSHVSLNAMKCYGWNRLSISSLH